jgi:hypothetical protein
MRVMPRSAWRVATVAAAALVLGHACAQAATRLADPAQARVSRWQGEIDRIDADARLALLSANDPRTHYVAGRLDRLDIGSAVAHFAAARVTAPQDPLYLATLALACLQRVQPPLPECDGVDRLADWARRDDDNGLPQLWLAERARLRNDAEATLAYVLQAAAAPRFDDYGARGALVVWEYFQAQPPGTEPAARAEAALGYAELVPWGFGDAAMHTCAGTSVPGDALRAACAKLGATMAERGASFDARRIGAAIAVRNASDASARARAVEQDARFAAERERCAALLPPAELESADPAVRARGLREADASVRTLARYGEVDGCARLLANVPP